MALSLGELVAAARQKDDQIGVTDRWQKGWNDLNGTNGEVAGEGIGLLMSGAGQGLGQGQNGGQGGLDMNSLASLGSLIAKFWGV